MEKRTNADVTVMGAGPAGSVAALCLRHRGRSVTVLERGRFPRYRIGESLLPGTMSILERLGVMDRVHAAGFPKKRAATFLWGAGRAPWSFTFATPKTAPWTYDHAYQVTRAEYDQILVEAAAERGADVRLEHDVTGIAMHGDEPVRVRWKSGANEGESTSRFIVDASGASGLVARTCQLRRFDEYYRNMAVWSYFRGGKRYGGELAGNIFSVTFPQGWIWHIPLKDDIYSVGVVTGVENAARIREVGADAFYRECLDQCDFSKDLLEHAEQCDEVRIVRDWAYDASQLAVDHAFICGDAGCFIDPLFSQGVHLATYSAVMAGAAIDYLIDRPDESESVMAWYDRSYRDAYNQYHKFLSAFYAHCDYPGSAFWEARRIHGASDSRFANQEWFATLQGTQLEDGGLDALEESAQTLTEIWDHGTDTVTESFDANSITTKRLRWAGELLRAFTKMKALRWRQGAPTLVSWYRVHPTSFALERQTYLGDGTGNALRSVPLGEDHRAVLAGLSTEPVGYRELTARFARLAAPIAAPLLVQRLIEEGFLVGEDAEGQPVPVHAGLRFGGVGAETEV
jgi:flavin-dependent dehydrogenase